MFNFKKLDIKILAGDKPNKIILEPFDEKICDFLTFFSQKIISNKTARKYPDLIALAFWCSKKNIYKLRKKNLHKDFRLGKGLIFHVTPSNVPTNFFYSLIFGLLSGNSNIVKIPSRNFPQISLICNLLNEIFRIKKYKFLKKLILIIKYKDNRENSISKVLSENCDLRIIWGGDKTINELRSYKIMPSATDITFGDRYSLCIINSEKIMKLSEKKLSLLIKDFFNDTYIIDQNACSSPHLIMWYGKNNKNAKLKFWDRLNKKIKKDYDLPMNAVTEKYNKFCLDMSRDNIFKKGKVISPYLYTLELKKITNEIENLRGRWGYFYEINVNDLNKIGRFITKKFQTLTYFGFKKKYFLDFFNKNKIYGIDRIVPIGKALYMDLDWDGYDIIKTLSRKISID